MESPSPSGPELNQSEKMVVAGVAFDFPANSPSTSKLPRPIRRRLSESRTPSTAEQIEAKLQEANLRRQQFYELLSNKARPKQRIPSQSSSQEVELGQRLEAKLNAAEQKRLDIIARARMRLARLDEMRQAAKSGMEMRVEKQRGELVMKVESRVKQAEANRMLFLKLGRQRKAARKERTAQSLMRRTMQETKYKECVRAAIHQKRLAAERKRLGLLEAERLKAQARFLQVQQVASSVTIRREMERIKKKHQLEDRLQRARRQRSELLRQQNSSNYSFGNEEMMHEQAKELATKLLRCWRWFMKSRGTTYTLVKTFRAVNINKKSSKSMPFDQLALRIESNVALKAVESLLGRLEVHLKVRFGTKLSGGMENIDHLLKRVSTPKRRRNVSHASRSQGQKKPMSRGEESTQRQCKLPRYPMRIALCAYMILGHPDAVLSGNGVQETALAEASVKFIQEFELLLKIILEGCSVKFSPDNVPMTFRSQLVSFDKAWCSYLYCFAVWKIRDARLLEEDLVRAACQMELSMMRTCKVTPNGDHNGGLTHDMKAIQEQVMKDQIILRAKVQNLSGVGGIVRMESALSDVRAKFFASNESGSSISSPVAQVLSPNSSSNGSPSPAEPRNMPGMKERERSSGVVHSLFKEGDTTALQEATPPLPTACVADVVFSNDISSITENQVIVNEIVHQDRLDFADNLDISNEDDNGIKAKMKETMEKAFWDGITDSMKQEQPDFSWVLKLMTEVRDELCKMSPRSWRQEITDTIDMDILSQVLKCVKLDMNYLGKLLEYALGTLQKLSAPANDDETKSSHENLLRELREVSQDGDSSNISCAIALIKGLQFILHQIQALKREISRARIRMIEPMIKGPAGLDYLRKAFSSQYGNPSKACVSLPLTKNWLSLVKTNVEQEWAEHMDTLSALPTTNQTTHTHDLLPTTLRTGGSVGVASRIRSLEPITAGKHQPECHGENIDLLVRLGLLNLVSGIEGLSLEALPETLKLNISRLRAAQSLLQKIVVISTSMLVLRQTLLTEHLIASPSEMESIISLSFKQLSELLDKVEDVGITEIVEATIVLQDSNDHCVADLEKLKTRSDVVTNMLSKSLKEGDPIFTRVSRVIFLAGRGAVLGGTGNKGRQLVDMELRRVGAGRLVDKLMEVGEAVIVMASVSRSVHGEWYDVLLKDM